jgi:hypothetical protein
MSTVMDVLHPNDSTLREARDRYFQSNGFGPNGGYDEPWVDFKIGPLPFPFPNSPTRVKAVRFHDLHHVLTGYATDIVGEFEIAGWEIAAGCKSMIAAWVLNLGGMGAGLFRCPRKTFLAFVRGRRQRSLYSEDYEALLATTVAEARARFAPSEVDLSLHVSDVVLFALASLAGLLVGLVTFALIVPLVPFGLLAHHLRKRAVAT